MQFIGSTFFVWSFPIGERSPNEKDMDVLHRQIPLTMSQIDTRSNLNTTPIIFAVKHFSYLRLSFAEKVPN